MKTSFLAAALWAAASLAASAQTSALQSASGTTDNSSAQSSPKYAVTERGGNHRIWERTENETAPDGKLVSRIHRYTELASGLYYTNASGEVLESKEEITILPQGGAAATNGQHQAFFPSDIHEGVIELVTPDGRHLKSRPLGLNYFDGSNSVLIAELAHSVGQILPSGNQVIYTNCFSDVAADLRYTYRKGGFEQDIILRQQPPSPEGFGLDSRKTRLEVLTEFFDTEDPVQTEDKSSSKGATGSTDMTLSFGTAKMVRGKAFSIGENRSARTRGVPVAKSWERMSGRTFLVEDVPVSAIEVELKKLPLTARVSAPAATSMFAERKASGSRFLPPHRLAQSSIGNKIELAKADEDDKSGVVLDYITIIDFGPGIPSFEANTTYYISDWLYSAGGEGVILFQSGCVLKFARGAALDLFNPISCETTPEHPAVFTAIDDNTVGETISGSTGTPSGTYAYYALAVESSAGPTPFQNLRVSYADNGIYATTTILNCEFHHVGTAILPAWDLSVGNVLLDDVGTGIDTWSGSTIDIAFLTAHNVDSLLSSSGNFSISDSLFISVTDLGHSFTGGYNGTSSGDSGIFQTSGTDSHYLATSSPYRNIGTTSVDATLLANIQTLTTFAPQDGSYDDTDTPDLGYHYPDGDSDNDGLLDAWETQYFGNLNQLAGNDYDADGVNNLAEYQAGTDPNTIAFSITSPSQYVNTTQPQLGLNIQAGVPSKIAIQVDNPNHAVATWTTYNATPTVNLGTVQGWHTVYIGLRGLPTTAQQTWQQVNLYLDTVNPVVSITSPANSISLNTTRVNIGGSFTENSLKQITVNGVPAFINGSSYEALNVPLDAGANTITATITDFAGNTATASISITGSSTPVDPVQLQASPIAGFSPLNVTFQPVNNAPGTLQQVFYDFNGDNVSDQTPVNLNPTAHSYAANDFNAAGEFFPVVTIQTTLGRFSSLGGWNGDSTRMRISVQQPPIPTIFLSNMQSPVDLKVTANGDLFVLSKSSAKVRQYNSAGTLIRSLQNIGGGSSAPTGFDVDSSGNVYVALNNTHRVTKILPSGSAFVVDSTFGTAGYIGTTTPSSVNGKFNLPYDVAVSPDGQEISVSDSGNHRIQRFSTSNGSFLGTYGSLGSAFGQFNTPKGLAYDGSGYLYIVDSGNNRVELVLGSNVIGAGGTAGSALGQFQGPVNLSLGTRGIYVGDAGNNRVQIFDLLTSGLEPPFNPRLTLANQFSPALNQPYAVAPVLDLLLEKLYIADTGNNRVLLVQLPVDTPEAAWSSMKQRLLAGDVAGAIPYFATHAAEDYRQLFLTFSASELTSMISPIPAISPIFVEGDKAQYYFQQPIDGVTITFPIDFIKENGLWKILEY